MISSRVLLIYFAVKYEGDWLKIYQAISNKEDVEYKDALAIAENLTCKVLTALDPEYPKYLSRMSCAPFVLFYYGDINLISDCNNNLSVVGSRKNTLYGKTITEEIVGKVCKKYNIVSGMAAGIDAIAHNACINSGGKTIAVLGCGIDYCYPSSNRELYEKIKQDHLVISEYPGVTEPKTTYFPIRNRIIAALGKGLLVTEARNGSGSSITAAWALEYNKDIMCVPNLAYSDSACNQWIKEGAFLVEKSSDVLEILSEYKKSKNLK